MPEENLEIVKFKQVEKVYPPTQSALSGIDFKVERGEFVFIAGSSGAGKSTLLKLISGEESSSKGEVLVDGKEISKLSRFKLAHLRRRIGVIFQDYKLLETRTVLENVAFALEVTGVRKKDRERQAYRLLAALGIDHRANAYPQTLSGGEQQRVAIARALVNCPDLILADEPTGNLDPDITAAVFNLLLEANRCGTTVIIASHNLALIEEMNKRTVVLSDGELIGDFSQTKS